jgi:hypothetical protein
MASYKHQKAKQSNYTHRAGTDSEHCPKEWISQSLQLRENYSQIGARGSVVG